METPMAEHAHLILNAHLLPKQIRFRNEGLVSAEVRRERIQQVINMLVKHADSLCDAMGEDFGGRPAVFSLANDIVGSLGSLKHARDHLDTWMHDDPRPSIPPFDSFGSTAWVRYQPKGVVGILGTWNAPLFTLLSPLASVLAAGNRAVLKPSEIAPRTASVLAEAIQAELDPEVVSLVTGDATIASDFTTLPWDHLVFTGSTSVGKLVMKAAAEHLVPVTLELGGKSPVLISQTADIRNAADRVAVGKSLNSGQLCVAPDTVWIHASQLEPFLNAMKEYYASFYPELASNPDVTPIINSNHLSRIESYLAEAAGVQTRIEIAGDAPSSQGGAHRRLPLYLVIDPPGESRISRNEIFGPAMVVRTYEHIQEAVAQVNSGDRPLALYYFGNDAAEQQWVMDNTLSGGVSINDVTMHPALHDAPFGGVGASGMGHYHGREGFLEFSHARTVYNAGHHDPRREWGMLPPYTPQFEQMIRSAINQ
jgi:coniferyl-aldehyde dehydrogenase